MISRMLESVFEGVRTFLTASWLLVFGVTAAWSQPTGQLTGVVRDTMGGVLPGVTVSVLSNRRTLGADLLERGAGLVDVLHVAGGERAGLLQLAVDVERAGVIALGGGKIGRAR